MRGPGTRRRKPAKCDGADAAPEDWSDVVRRAILGAHEDVLAERARRRNLGIIDEKGRLVTKA